MCSRGGGKICIQVMPMHYVQLCAVYLPPALPPNPKRPTMLTNLLIAIGVVVVVAFIFSPAG